MSFEFHVSRAARDKYRFDDVLFSTNGTAVFANMAAVRQFAQKINEVRDTRRNPDRAVHAGALNAMGLIDEALHVLLAKYREERDPKAISDALSYLDSHLGRPSVDRLLVAFAEEFPTVAVYRGRQSASEWLKGSTGDTPHRNVALEEALFLWLANANPAFKRYQELFDDSRLASGTEYPKVAPLLRDFFDTRPRFGPDNLNVIDLLRAPALASPDSLAGQLAFIRERWRPVLGSFVERLETAVGILQEEEVAVWMQYHPPAADRPFGGGVTGDSSAAAIPHFDREAFKTTSGGEPEYERFSPDVDWMPRTVMIAKSAYVWLNQLSKQYRRDIRRLDQVPDEELDVFARRGFNAVWIIGVWQRSKASQRIKQLCGNPDAGSSAYSLYDYAIADDLGGEAAYSNLRERASARGIRLASDMVPNHMGIDSRWVMEHPNWFVSLPYPPFPAYRFEGPDVAHDGRIEIKIEDHYYDRSDASVVFMRRDRWTGETCFIYHGNDGTSFPWNDTAQLNYLMAEVREAVIQTILHVARQFPIIRFDAAMTLTKKHYQRLWFPQPGTGSAIASRAEFGLTKEQFDAAMPQEFWREVVDRVAVEAPGTLLLAEAFWLLEGYFVRTLGMHRVYNSAFMNMLRDEENANYRSVIKNTLEFDPDVLKRYVNFMSNPDERTAIDQFGKGDKYFGVCTLLATMPGLPMIGHGQFEGYTERYGMEYQRAYLDEWPDQWLVARHEREISPLLHRRHLFAEVRDFLLYDFFSDDGSVNEDVYAYSNQAHGDRALVVFHNRYGTTRGWIRTSATYAEKNEHGDKNLRQRTFGEAFRLSGDPKQFVTFRDAITGLEYLHRSGALIEQGIHLELTAYRYHVFLDWRDVRDDATRPWSALCDKLHGRGVTSLEDELRALELEPVHAAVFALLDRTVIERLVESANAAADKRPASAKTAKKTQSATLAESAAPQNGDNAKQFAGEVAAASERVRTLLSEISRFSSGASATAMGMGSLGEWRGDIDAAVKRFEERLRSALRLPEVEANFSEPWPAEACAVLPSCTNSAVQQASTWAMLVAWAAIEAIGTLHTPAAPERPAEVIFERFRLREAVATAMESFGLEGEAKWRSAALIRASFAHAAFAPSTEESTGPVRLTWLHDAEVAWLIGVHEYEGIRYLVREPFERLLWWVSLRSLLDLAAEKTPAPLKIQALEKALRSRVRAAEQSGFDVEVLLDSPDAGSGKSPQPGKPKPRTDESKEKEAERPPAKPVR